MKLTKFFMIAAAIIAFAACSDDKMGSTVNGEATVRVRIDEPALSRAITSSDYTSVTDVKLSSIKLVLTAQTGGRDKNFSITDYQNSNTALLNAVKEYQFTGVRNPSKMEVFINTDKKSGWTLADVYNKGLEEPLYASSTTFADKGDTDSDGINEYEVQLAPEHTVARLEFGGIKHIHTSGNCMFKTITIDGIFLNNVSSLTANNWTEAQTNIPVHSVINADFKGAGDPTWPASGCYGYNILPTSTLPVLTVCFSNITINTADPNYTNIVWTGTNGYATVKNYKLDESYKNNTTYVNAFGITNTTDSSKEDYMVIKKFPAGYVYQVKDLSIPDEAIGQGISGGEDVHIYAVVTVSPWNIVTGSVEWN